MSKIKRIYAVRPAEKNDCKCCNRSYTIIGKLKKCSCEHTHTKGKK